MSLGSSFVHAEIPAVDPNVTEAIEFLLGSIAKSECIFVRNGEEHTGAESAKHMRAKYDYFKKKITTPEDFIRLAGTQSVLTRKAYTVKKKDGKEIASAEWLGQRLRNYHQSSQEKQNPVVTSGECVLRLVGNPAATSATPPTSPTPR